MFHERHSVPSFIHLKEKSHCTTMPLWRDVCLDDVEVQGTKFSIQYQPFRFQIPKGRVLYNGLSNFKSITIEVPPSFVEWWRTRLEPILAKDLAPFNSNVKDSSLRIKIDGSTQFFNSAKEIYFPELKEGLLEGASVQCIVEVSGTYFFKEMHGLVVRAHQVVSLSEPLPPPSPEEELSPGDRLQGFAFTFDGSSGFGA